MDTKLTVEPGCKLYCGDALTVLRDDLEPNSIQCSVTSPPYWGLRDYGTAKWDGGDEGCDHVSASMPPVIGSSSTLGVPSDGGPRRIGNANTYHEAYRRQFRNVCSKCGAIRIDSQLGLESTPDEYVENMVEIFREVRRVLRDDGTLWLNLGDSYHNVRTHNNGGVPTNTVHRGGSRDGIEGFGRTNRNRRQEGLKEKDLCGIPWRVALALQADGWYLRSDIIWEKPNPMPESVTDRPTKSHEYIFLLTKSAKYFYDAEAIKEPGSNNLVTVARNRRSDEGRVGPAELYGTHHGQSGNGGHDRTVGFRNKRDVWTVTTKSYPGAHFATFPPDLIRPCILAGTSEKGCCAECGSPWERIVERKHYGSKGPEEVGQDAAVVGMSRNALGGQKVWESYVPPTTTGWQPTCECDAKTVPCTVLDPFMGSGTTAEVARESHCKAVGIELNPEYVKLSRKRLEQLSLFSEAE